MRNDGALVRRDLFPGLSKFGKRSWIIIVREMRADMPPNEGNRPTLNRSRLVSEERIQRLRFICGKVPSEEDIVVCTRTCQCQKKK